MPQNWKVTLLTAQWRCRLLTLLSVLLRLVEDLLPSGQQQWDQLAIEYHTLKSKDLPVRNVESLRRKFNQLKNVKKPTGQFVTTVCCM
jgi:hypothetical protein